MNNYKNLVLMNEDMWISYRDDMNIMNIEKVFAVAENEDSKESVLLTVNKQGVVDKVNEYARLHHSKQAMIEQVLASVNVDVFSIERFLEDVYIDEEEYSEYEIAEFETRRESATLDLIDITNKVENNEITDVHHLEQLIDDVQRLKNYLTVLCMCKFETNGTITTKYDMLEE